MTELVLAFEEYPDDEIRARISPVSINTFFAVADAYGDGAWPDRAAIDALYKAFEPVLVSWTFDVPATAAGMAEIDAKLSFAIVRRWLEEVRSVPAPLPLTSSDGVPSEDPSPELSPAPAGSEAS